MITPLRRSVTETKRRSAAVKVEEKTYLRISEMRSRYGPEGDDHLGAK